MVGESQLVTGGGLFIVIITDLSGLLRRHILDRQVTSIANNGEVEVNDYHSDLFSFPNYLPTFLNNICWVVLVVIQFTLQCNLTLLQSCCRVSSAFILHLLCEDRSWS